MIKKLETLRKEIEITQKRIEKENKKEKLEEEKKKREKEEFWRKEEEKLPEKLELAERIFQWGKNFSESEEYGRLVGFNSSSLTGSEYNALWLYSGEWGHRKDGDHFGCWSRIYLQKDGSFTYKAGYKWMGFNNVFDLETSEKMARKLTRNYIGKFHHFIESGEVYKNLKAKLKEDH